MSLSTPRLTTKVCIFVIPQEWRDDTWDLFRSYSRDVWAALVEGYDGADPVVEADWPLWTPTLTLNGNAGRLTVECPGSLIVDVMMRAATQQNYRTNVCSATRELTKKGITVASQRGITMRKLTFASLCAVLLMSACGDDSGTAETTTSAVPTTVATTTTTIEATTTTLSPEELAAMEYDADVMLIKQLWRGSSDSWFSSFEKGVQYRIDHNYPDERCTFDDYMTFVFPEGPLEGFQVEDVVDASTIERDEGWIIPGGRTDGMLAKGRVYIMSVTTTRSVPGYESSPPETNEVHVTILDGEPYFFFTCSD